MMKLWLTTTMLLLFTATVFSAADEIKAFPPAEEGMVRYVLKVPDLARETDCKIELIVGKTIQIDAENNYFFGGRIEAESIVGWGYTRYIVKEIGPLAGTLMAIDPNAPKVARFIPLGGEPYLVRYNSRLPIVIYIPDGAEVRYRIWSAQTEAKPLEKG